jgi:thioredoxin 1
MPLQLTKENFETEVLQSSKPVLVDFWASWCHPCKMLAPVLEEAAAEVTGVTVGKVNVDEESSLAEKYGVMSIPTLLLFKDGKLVKRGVGAMPKANIIEFMKS